MKPRTQAQRGRSLSLGVLIRTSPDLSELRCQSSLHDVLRADPFLQPWHHILLFYSWNNLVRSIQPFADEGRDVSSVLPACTGQAQTRTQVTRTPGAPPSADPSSLLSESASTLEGNVLEPVPRAELSCHPPSCRDPGVWHPVPAGRPRLGGYIQLLSHGRQGGGPGRSHSSRVFQPVLPPAP